jgi:uncharacterized membrane protein YkoI
MKTVMTVTLTLVVSGLAWQEASAAERAIQRKDLPAAVQNTVRQEEGKGATIKAISAEKQRGRTVYEVETTVSGRTRDLIIDRAGAIVEIEEEVSMDAVPAAARAALEASGKVIKVETLKKGAAATAVIYEAQIEKNGKKSEVAVDPSGKRVKG